MKLILLPKGLFTLVSPQDFEYLNGFNWCIWSPKTSPHLHYAYRNIRIKGVRKKIFMHREILGNPPEEVDHRDGDSLNNQRENLRVASTAQNQANSRKHRDATSSRFKGVAYHKGAFQAQIQHNKKRIYLGRFRTEELAAETYNQAARNLFGNFARLNVI
jgi:hypothetical protein